MPASLTGAQRGLKTGDGGRGVGTQEVAGFRGKGEKQCLAELGGRVSEDSVS